MQELNVIEKLKEIFDDLTPKLQKVASYIIDHHKEVAFLNATALANLAGVSEATVTRLTYMLNMTGYQDFRQALQQHAKNYLSLPKYEFNKDEHSILAKVAIMEKSIIDEMLTNHNPAEFEKAVEILYKARKITVIGLHYNSMPASYAAYFLGAFRENVYFADKLDIEVFKQVQLANKNDVVLVLSTARYPKTIQNILPLYKEKGTTIIAITDSQVAPVTSLADLSLIVPMKFISYIDPYAAIMVLIHALVTGVFLKGSDKAKKRLKDFNEFMDQNNYNSVTNVDVTELL